MQPIIAVWSERSDSLKGTDVVNRLYEGLPIIVSGSLASLHSSMAISYIEYWP